MGAAGTALLLPPALHIPTKPLKGAESDLISIAKEAGRHSTSARLVDLATVTVCSVKHKAHLHVFYRAAHCRSLSAGSYTLTHILALQAVG